MGMQRTRYNQVAVVVVVVDDDERRKSFIVFALTRAQAICRMRAILEGIRGQCFVVSLSSLLFSLFFWRRDGAGTRKESARNTQTQREGKRCVKPARARPDC